ncbi:MAG: HAD-IA family hydrolase [Pseudomonadota bacterium]
MSQAAILFGSIGVIAETSNIQRRAYNQAFQEFDLSWYWDEATYRDLLTSAGGRARLARLSNEAGQPIETNKVVAIHARKTAIACAEIRRDGVNLRSGVQDTIDLARSRDIALGFVTTTYRENIDALLDGAGLSASIFSIILDRSDVSASKPAPDIYLEALKRLNASADAVIAVEDTAVSESAARTACIKTIVTPGEFTANQKTPLATCRAENLKLALPFLQSWLGDIATAA